MKIHRRDGTVFCDILTVAGGTFNGAFLFQADLSEAMISEGGNPGLRSLEAQLDAMGFRLAVALEEAS
ncbi:MAG: hypothetical protein ACREVB_11040 [Burkholderiales bacterium]